MNTYAERMTIIIMTLVTTCIAAVTAGTILWLIWEDSLSAMFPGAVAAGVLAAKLTWWQSVKIVWVFSILIKIVIEPKYPQNKESSDNKKQ
jgi:hypothetical protein